MHPNPEQDGPFVKGVLEKVEKEPLPLPQGFEWVTVDLKNQEDLKQLYTLLANHYVEDDDAIFRFDYPEEFLNWTLCCPGYLQEWHVGVKATGKDTLLGFISGTPVKS